MKRGEISIHSMHTHVFFFVEEEKKKTFELRSIRVFFLMLYQCELSE